MGPNLFSTILILTFQFFKAQITFKCTKSYRYASIWIKVGAHCTHDGSLCRLMYAYVLLAVKELNKNLGFILEDKDCIDETLKMKYINVIKMLIYIYTEFVKLIQNKIELKRTEKIQLKVGKGRKKSDDDEFDTFDRKTILLSLNSIIQQDINVLWDPPVVEESLTK